MKAIRIAAYGDASHLTLKDVPTPAPGPGEVLVRQHLAGLNFIDIYVRNGLYAKSHTYAQTLPFTLGMEAAGEVAAVGPDVDGLAVGTRVAYCIHLGAFAEYAVVPAWKLVKVPDGVPLDIACALQLQGSTAHYLSHSAFALGRAHTCLVHAGAGGVGQLLIQLAKRRGARVITTVGSMEKAKIACGRGADKVILYREESVPERVHDITGGAGVDVVYDSVGKDTFHDSLKCLKRRGLIVLFGASSGAVTEVSPLALAEAGSVFFTRPHLADYIATADERQGRADDLFAAYLEGALTVTIDAVMPLAAAADAQRRLEARKSQGKILLAI